MQPQPGVRLATARLGGELPFIPNVIALPFSLADECDAGHVQGATLAITSCVTRRCHKEIDARVHDVDFGRSVGSALAAGVNSSASGTSAMLSQ